MNDKKLQQDAFMWFREQYGSTPEELGYKVAATYSMLVILITIGLFFLSLTSFTINSGN